jgi:hypothetical protein
MKLLPLLEQLCLPFLLVRIKYNTIIEGAQIDAPRVFGDADALCAFIRIDHIN